MQQPTPCGEADVLKRMTVRLVREEERGEFDFRLEDQHSLQSARLAGQTLRYVAELDGEWVALICFGAAALHLKGREQWIGWTDRRRARRLGFVVNHSRFLVLPGCRQKHPNLASRVLGLCLRRLSSDWQQPWGHPVLVVESFVDESRYRGPCYKACGFEAVGLTEGYGRSSRDFYQEHGQPKVLACAAGATLMGAGGYQGFEDLCGKLTQRQLRALGCRRNQEGRSVPPSDSTFFRVISRLDAAQFELVVGSWLLEQEVSVLARLAVDGKVLRGSGRNDGRPLQLLSAVTHRLRLTLGQIAIAEKSNEIPALKPLLQSLPDLAGSPEEIGLCGCWQVIAVRRERAWLGRPPKPARVEIGDYATSLSQPQQDDQESRAPQRPVKAGPRGAGTRFAKQPRRAAARLSLVQTALVGNAAPRLLQMK